jgi:hypothetical protein
MISEAARRTLAMSDRSHTTDTARWPFSSMAFLHFAEFRAVATDQDDPAVLGQLKCCGSTYAGGRARDDVRFAIRGGGVRHVCLRCLSVGPISAQDFASPLAFGPGADLADPSGRDSRIFVGKAGGVTLKRSAADDKIAWQGALLSVQPQIRLTRSFDQRSDNFAEHNDEYAEHYEF